MYDISACSATRVKERGILRELRAGRWASACCRYTAAKVTIKIIPGIQMHKSTHVIAVAPRPRAAQPGSPIDGGGGCGGGAHAGASGQSPHEHLNAGSQHEGTALSYGVMWSGTSDE